MEPEYHSEQRIIHRYELDFHIDERRNDARYSSRMAAALAGAGVSFHLVTQELTESERIWARVTEVGTIYTSGILVAFGGLALVNATQDYIAYRRGQRAAEEADA